MTQQDFHGGSMGGMTEGGGRLSPDVVTGPIGSQGLSKEAIGAAPSKLISARNGSLFRFCWGRY